MDSYIEKCKLLGTIDIDFLEKVSKSEEWDRLFYDMFELLMSVEENTEEFFIYNKDRLFFLKKEKSMEIEIREALDFFNKESEEEFVIVVDQKKRNESVLIPKIVNYLKQKKVGYQLLSKTNVRRSFKKDISEIITINR
ncbi:hypothetical protein AB290_11810 [Listeria monocytogenes]|uniref:hypothetical protein n=1 Tax=Listeria monocytogenes TaxID=1639 RepID=UPI0010F1B31F|nr:hypothetical protein [Listeria monocytogenes]EAD7632603.1 hypothetical protein [Listeria monocytogenes]